MMFLHCYITVLLLAIGLCSLKAQEFLKAYGNDEYNSIDNSIYSDFYKSYYLYGTTNEDIPTVSRLDQNGNILWTRSYATGLYASDIAELHIRGQAAPDLVICMSRTGSYSDIIVMRIRGTDGAVVWSNVYAPESMVRFSHMVITSDSNILITGTYSGNSATFYAKLDPSGEAIWGKRYYSLVESQFAATGDIYPTQDGGVIGSCASPSSNGLFIVDSNGNLKAYKRTDTRYVFRRIERAENGFIISTLQEWDNRSINQGLLRVDENLNVMWSRRLNPVSPFLGSCSSCASPAAAQTPDGNFIYVQETALSGRIAYNVLKFSSSGQILLSKTFKNPDVFFSLLKTTANGKILISGSTNRSGLCLPSSPLNGIFGVTTENLDICEMNTITPRVQDWGITLTTLPFEQIDVTEVPVNKSAFSKDSRTITFNATEFCEDIANKVDLGPDINACIDEVSLNAGTGFSSYLWSTGATSPAITIRSSGTYSVAVTTICGTTLRDTINVSFGTSQIQISADKNPVKSGTTVTLSTPTAANQQYNWQPSAMVSDPNTPTVTAVITADTWFYLTVTDLNGCQSTDSILIEIISEEDSADIFIPSAFSPNGDGINDRLFVMTTIDGVSINYFRIYNRWGQMVYSVENVPANSRQNGWNGLFKSEPSPMDNYIYVAEATLPNGRKIMKKGGVLLIR